MNKRAFFAFVAGLLFIGQEAHAVDRPIPCNATSPCALQLYVTTAGGVSTNALTLSATGNLLMNAASAKFVAQNGTTSSPSITFASDTTTGFSRSNANTLDFITGASDVMQVVGATVAMGTTTNSIGSVLAINPTVDNQVGIAIDASTTNRPGKLRFRDAFSHNGQIQASLGMDFYAQNETVLAGGYNSSGQWQLGPTNKKIIAASNAHSSSNGGVAMAGNDHTQLMTVSNSGTATVTITGAGSQASALILIKDYLGTANSVLVWVGGLNTVTILTQNGSQFTTSAPTTTQMQISYSGSTNVVTFTAGATGGTTGLALYMMSPAL